MATTTLTVKDGSGASASLAVESVAGVLTPHSVPEIAGAPVSGGNPMPVADAKAFLGIVAITPGTAVAAARSLGYVCTAAGNITLTFPDASTITIALTVNPAFQTLPFAVTNVALGSGTAGSFWNLK